MTNAAAIAATVALNSRLLSMSLAPMEQRDDGKFVHDRIVEANASLFTESYFSEPLTGYAVGWRDPNNIEDTLAFYAPEVLVPRFFQYAELNNAEEFYSESDDLRAIRGDFGTVEYTQGKVTAKTENRGLRVCVDLDEVADKNGWREFYTRKLMRRLKRNSLRRALALLSAAATNTARTWDASALKDPDADVNNELILATTVSGIRPNRVGYGDTAWSRRLLAHRAQNTAGGFASAGMTPEQLAAFLALERVGISRERFSTGGARSEILGSQVLMFMAEDGMDTEDPSTIKRFVSPCEGGGTSRVYERQISAKLYEIVVEHYELTRIVSTLGIRRFTVS